MSIKPIYASAGGGADFEPLPEGRYVARCYRMVDTGTHLDVYPNQAFPAKPKREVILYFEVLRDENGEPITMEDGRPFSVNQKYTLSLHKKSQLRPALENWRGKKFTDEEVQKFNIAQVVGAFCELQIVHNLSKDGTKTFANIGQIMAARKRDIEGVEGVNPIVAWSVDDPDQEEFNKFSEFLQKRINESDEMKAKPLAAAPREDSQQAAPVTAKADESPADDSEEADPDELNNVGF